MLNPRTKKLIFFLFQGLCVPLVHADAAADQAKNYADFIQTCVCRNCDLNHLNLEKFVLDPKTHPDCQAECSLENANLDSASLKKANITVCVRGYVSPYKSFSFSKANLKEANLNSSKLIGVNFKAANFKYAQFQHAYLSLCDFQNANFSFAEMTNATSPRDAMHGWGSNFSGADFSFANLKGSNLYGNFTKVSFAHTFLDYAKLSTGSGAFETKPANDADYWAGVDFSYCDLQGTTITTDGKPADLSKATICQTIMPDGKISNRDCN